MGKHKVIDRSSHSQSTSRYRNRGRHDDNYNSRPSQYFHKRYDRRSVDSKRYNINKRRHRHRTEDWNMSRKAPAATSANDELISILINKVPKRRSQATRRARAEAFKLKGMLDR